MDTIKRPSAVNLFRRGSTFRYSGRTQFRVLQDNTKGRRSSRKFERFVHSVCVCVYESWNVRVICRMQADKSKLFSTKDHLTIIST